MSTISNLANMPADTLVTELHALAIVFGARDLVIEISPTHGFRIVREGNTAQGILANRHRMIGLLVCLIDQTYETDVSPEAFWKEVLA
ncbi:MAG TPA: hypothetical protein VK985_09435 [Rariglobus sp.]|nr:hypothetical protein [Rariglobus sp.]